MFYMLEQKHVANLIIILKNAEFKGKDANRVVEIMKLLADGKSAPYYKLSDKQRNLLIEIIDNITIKGEFAFAIVAIQVALGKGTKSIPRKTTKKGLPQPNVSDNKG